MLINKKECNWISAKSPHFGAWPRPNVTKFIPSMLTQQWNLKNTKLPNFCHWDWKIIKCNAVNFQQKLTCCVKRTSARCQSRTKELPEVFSENVSARWFETIVKSKKRTSFFILGSLGVVSLIVRSCTKIVESDNVNFKWILIVLYWIIRFQRKRLNLLPHSKTMM